MSTNAPNDAHGTGNLHLVNKDNSCSPKEFLLALQLKQNGEFVDTDSTDGVMRISYIVSFNDSFLRKKIMKSSTHYDPKIDLNLLVRNTFPPNEWWANVLYCWMQSSMLANCLVSVGYSSAITSNVITMKNKNMPGVMSLDHCIASALSTFISKPSTIQNWNQKQL